MKAKFIEHEGACLCMLRKLYQIADFGLRVALWL
jgi:hypothetical protein